MTGKVKKKGGCPPDEDDPRIWKVGELEITTALISMCIKEDLNQTLEELASRVAVDKCRPLGESLAVLRELEEKGRLGYYTTSTPSTVANMAEYTAIRILTQTELRKSSRRNTCR